MLFETLLIVHVRAKGLFKSFTVTQKAKHFSFKIEHMHGTCILNFYKHQVSSLSADKSGPVVQLIKSKQTRHE